jgi:hypothetical protein
MFIERGSWGHCITVQLRISVKVFFKWVHYCFSYKVCNKLKYLNNPASSKWSEVTGVIWYKNCETFVRKSLVSLSDPSIFMTDSILDISRWQFQGIIIPTSYHWQGTEFSRPCCFLYDNRLQSTPFLCETTTNHEVHCSRLIWNSYWLY